MNKTEQIHLLLKHLLRTGALLEKTGNRLLEKHRLTQQQFIVLNEIKRNDQITPQEIVNELGFEKSNISKIVKKLQTLGYIEIRTHPDDKRSILLSITRSGSKTWKTSLDEMNKENERLFQHTNINEIILMKEYLQKINTRILENES